LDLIDARLELVEYGYLASKRETLSVDYSITKHCFGIGFIFVKFLLQNIHINLLYEDYFVIINFVTEKIIKSINPYDMAYFY